MIPAEFTKISTRPKDSRVLACNASIDDRSSTSTVSASDRRPAALMSAVVCSTSDVRREAAITSAPAFASPSAIARPMPDVPPSTTAVFPHK